MTPGEIQRVHCLKTITISGFHSIGRMHVCRLVVAVLGVPFSDGKVWCSRAELSVSSPLVMRKQHSKRLQFFLLMYVYEMGCVFLASRNPFYNMIPCFSGSWKYRHGFKGKTFSFCWSLKYPEWFQIATSPLARLSAGGDRSFFRPPVEATLLDHVVANTSLDVSLSAGRQSQIEQRADHIDTLTSFSTKKSLCCFMHKEAATVN